MQTYDYQFNATDTGDHGGLIFTPKKTLSLLSLSTIQGLLTITDINHFTRVVSQIISYLWPFIIDHRHHNQYLIQYALDFKPRPQMKQRSVNPFFLTPQGTLVGHTGKVNSVMNDKETV